jgi:anaerobic ribonucleoside-triphosphate reductase activating protein
MGEIVINIDARTGASAAGGLEEAGQVDVARALLGVPQVLHCAAPPREVLVALPPALPHPGHGVLRVNALYHGSLVEGRGIVSTLRLQGCSIRCPGCIVPQTWLFRGGTLLAVETVRDLLLDPAHDRDGVCILGGEPLDQPEGVALLLTLLKERDVHVTLYSGYDLGSLLRRRRPAIRAALALADVLIDGPYDKVLARGAGEWRGSSNQRVWEHLALQDALRAGTPSP